jgi:hypothetical protein
MVPIGPLAFMPGHLIHTNEITVLLGESYFAERSAEQASGIISRRKNFVQKLIVKSEADEKKLSARAHTSDHIRKSLLEGFAEEQAEDAAQSNQPPNDDDDDDEYDEYEDEDEDDGKVVLSASGIRAGVPPRSPSSARRAGRATTSGLARASSGPGPTRRMIQPALVPRARTRSSQSSRLWSRSAGARAE